MSDEKIDIMKADLDKALTENMQLTDRLHYLKREANELYSKLQRETKHVDMLMHVVSRLSKSVDID